MSKIIIKISNDMSEDLQSHLTSMTTDLYNNIDRIEELEEKVQKLTTRIEEIEDYLEIKLIAVGDHKPKKEKK